MYMCVVVCVHGMYVVYVYIYIYIYIYNVMVYLSKCPPRLRAACMHA